MFIAPCLLRNEETSPLQLCIYSYNYSRKFESTTRTDFSLSLSLQSRKLRATYAARTPLKFQLRPDASLRRVLACFLFYGRSATEQPEDGFLSRIRARPDVSARGFPARFRVPNPSGRALLFPGRIRNACFNYYVHWNCRARYSKCLPFGSWEKRNHVFSRILYIPIYIYIYIYIYI